MPTHAHRTRQNDDHLPGFAEKLTEKPTEKCSVSVSFFTKKKRPKPTDFLLRNRKTDRAISYFWFTTLPVGVFFSVLFFSFLCSLLDFSLGVLLSFLLLLWLPICFLLSSSLVCFCILLLTRLISFSFLFSTFFLVFLCFLFFLFQCIGAADVCSLRHGIVLLILLLSTWCNVAACVVVLWPQSLLSIIRMKNQRGHWVCWMSTSRKNGIKWRTHTYQYSYSSIMCYQHHACWTEYCYLWSSSNAVHLDPHLQGAKAQLTLPKCHRTHWEIERDVRTLNNAIRPVPSTSFSF